MEWLGQVPEHWEVRRIGYYFNERREKVSDKDFPPLSVTKNGIVPQIETAAKSDDGDNRKKVCKGDFVINSRSDRKGSAGTSELDGSVSLICTVLCPQEKVHAPFAHYLLRCQPFQEEFYRNGKGIVADLWSTNYSEMRNILLAIPLLNEQIAIADFLDRDTAKIDELIAEQERLIELLKEKRQAVISHAVTKGLNPDAPMRDSGIEWIGQVPEHWEVRPIKDYYQTSSGGTPNTSLQSLYYTEKESGFPWIRTTDLKDSEINSAEIYITQKALEDTACSILPKGSVLIAMYGGDGTIGKNGLLNIPSTINQALCALLPNKTHDPEYTFRYIQYYRPYWMISAESSRVDPNISQDRVRKGPILAPPLDEQEKIVSYLQEELHMIDILSTEAQKAITLLQERRSALISAAVTGQIDVRGIQHQEAA